MITLNCECGKPNRVDPATVADEIYCIRCSRPIPLPKFSPPPAEAVDPNGLTTPAGLNDAELDRRRLQDQLGPTPDTSSNLREYLYWLLPLALLPLAISLGEPHDDPQARFERTLKSLPAGQQQAIERKLDKGADYEDVIRLFPYERIEGAFLPRTSKYHLAFGLAATALFLTLAFMFFAPGTVPPIKLLMIGFFTGTAGVVFLLFAVRLFPIVAPDILHEKSRTTEQIILNMVGYIFGVGLFEELAKALPLIWRIRHFGPMRWRAGLLWGLATGVGFGISEALLYGSEYHGISRASDYVVRFISCVALHGILSASVGVSLCQSYREILTTDDYVVFGASVLKIIAVPAILHGLYDSALHQDWDLAALVIAAAAFAWLALQVETVRRDPELG